MTHEITAPAALGVGITTGIAAMIVGGYRIADCLSYRTGPGQCTSVVEDNAMALVGGAASLTAAWGGFNTLNRKLHPVEDSPRAAVAASAPPAPPPAPPAPPPVVPLFTSDTVEPPVVAAEPPVEPPEVTPDVDLDSIIRQMIEVGGSRQQVAAKLQIPLSRVRKALQPPAQEE